MAELNEMIYESDAETDYAFPLSVAQRRLWVLSQFGGGSEAYHICAVFEVMGNLRLDYLNQSFQNVVDRHDALRTTFQLIGDEPRQVVVSTSKVAIETADLRMLNGEEKHARITKEKEYVLLQKFDLGAGPLWRVKLLQIEEGIGLLLFAVHHLIFDGWSMEIFINELKSSYESIEKGELPNLPPVEIQYVDFAVSQNQWLCGEHSRRMMDYWKRTLAGTDGVIHLPLDKQRPALQNFEGGTVSFRLNKETLWLQKRLSKRWKSSMHMMMLAVFSIVLMRWTGQKDLMIGSPASGRGRKEIDGLIGFFVNTLPLRLNLSNVSSFSELVQHVRHMVLEAQTHQEIPLERIIEGLDLNTDASHNPLFQVFYAYQQGDAAQIQIGNAQLAAQTIDTGTAKFDLSLIVTENNDDLKADIEYRTDLFDKKTILRMAGHLRHTAEYISKNPDVLIADLSILTTDEKTQLVTTWNETNIEWPKRGCIHELFEQSAHHHGSQVAVQYKNQSITYQELNRSAQRVARILESENIGRDMIIGVYMRPCIKMVISLLGIHKAGASYLPLDPDFPEKRIGDMLEDSRSPLIIVDSSQGISVPPFDKEVLDLAEFSPYEDIKENSVTGSASMDDKRLAYVIYTSGSTGKSKGVQIQHNHVVNFLWAMQRELKLGPQDVWVSVTTLSFDISVLEIFLPLLTGAKLVIASREEVMDGERLAGLISACQATFMQATPTGWKILLDAQWQGKPNLEILCGGETLPPNLAQKLISAGSRVWNMYGPTETTIWSLMYQIPKDTRDVAIGRPIANTRVYILDEDMHPVPIGVAGELFIAGDGVARGYLNKEALTSKRFILDPFRPESGQCMYRTGDLVRYRPNGCIEFLGRLDHQVKVSGHRIELGEIETALDQHTKIKEAVVIAHEQGDGAKCLVAYYVSNQKELPTNSELRVFLGKSLPGYMIPQIFIPLEAFPLTPNKKIDRNVLPAPNRDRPDLKEAYTPPKNETERRVATIWEEVLKLDRVGVHDNFFDLGGSSLECVVIVNRIRNAGMQITPEDIFKHLTIAGISALIGELPIQNVHHNEATHISAQEMHHREDDSGLVELNEKRFKIESLGVYLPAVILNTQEILDGCKNKLKFPLKRITGIEERRKVSEGEYSIHLAQKAIKDAFSRSIYHPEDIDLLICCNISRYDAKNKFSFEPSTSSKLAARFGMVNSIVYDITNACTGMFTALSVADASLKSGAAERVLIVSGEYITHLTDTAQNEVMDYLDPRMACITLGDSAVALILDEALDETVGFHELEMFTLGAYSSLCIAKQSDGSHGGVIMYTDAVKMAEEGYMPSAAHTLQTMKKAKLTSKDIDYLIMHQASKITIDTARKKINEYLNDDSYGDKKIINNVAKRGNTATTTHFVALNDYIRKGDIEPHHNILFSISGSGMNFGTTLYKMDDLPVRIQNNIKPPKTRCQRPERGRTNPSGVVIVSMNAEAKGMQNSMNSVEMAIEAGRKCLRRAPFKKEDIDLIIFSGLYRSEFIAEPAIAAFVAGGLNINATLDSQVGRTLAFDVLNGQVGFLNSCQIAVQHMLSGKTEKALIVTSEVENNKQVRPEKQLGIMESGAGLLLSATGRSDQGFGGFYFKCFPEYADMFTSYWTWSDNNHYLEFERKDQYEDVLINAICEVTQRFLSFEEIDKDRICKFFPPRMSHRFVDKLSSALNVNHDQLILAKDSDKDPFTAAFPIGAGQVLNRDTVEEGDIGLIISAGSGVQVGMALYYF